MVTTDLSKHLLSKSTFMRGCQCPKSLWLHKYKPGLRTEVDNHQEAIFQQGQDVGMLARDLFPGGADASPATSFEYQKSVALTAELIKSGKKVIYEATFQYNGILVAIDILVNRKGKWYAYEVKSATSVKPEYIIDASLQYYVIIHAGLELADLSIMHINNGYIRKGELVVSELFKSEPITGQVEEYQSEVEAKIGELKGILKSKTVPAIKIGPQCRSPYECDFMGHCWKDIPENSVFDLRGRGASELAFELFNKGIIEMRQIPKNYELSNAIRFQVDSFVNKEATIEINDIKVFLSKLVYPLYYLDFETYSTAIPEYDYSWPYEQIPFQFSLHIQKTAGAVPEHIEFLAEAGKDPRENFVKALISSLGKKGTIIAYNMAFEARIMKELADIFPNYRKQLLTFTERLYDLMVPFRKKMYYKPEMKGSYSIKEVLPTLASDFSYENLPINNGALASTTFYNLKFEKDMEKGKEIRKSLLEYCGLDTLAMVKIIEVLQTIIQ